MTDSEMKADAFVATLNDYVKASTEDLLSWGKDTGNINSGYPILLLFKVTSLSYTDTLASAGGVVEIVLSGENLASYNDTVTLTVTSSTETLRTSKIEKDGDVIRVCLSLPANIGEKDMVYNLSVSLGATVQNLTGYKLTVKAPSAAEENSPLDLNGDGSVNVMDVIYLIRRITSFAS